ERKLLKTLHCAKLVICSVCAHFMLQTTSPRIHGRIHDFSQDTSKNYICFDFSRIEKFRSAFERSADKAVYYRRPWNDRQPRASAAGLQHVRVGVVSAGDVRAFG